MDRIGRFVIVLVFVAGVLALGFQSDAWANRLTAGSISPMSGLASAPDQTAAAGDCPAGILTVKSAPSGVIYRAYGVSTAELPKPVPGPNVNCAFKIVTIKTTDLASDARVCWPILDTQAGSAYYYDGSQWKALVPNASNESCADYVPGSAPKPALYVPKSAPNPVLVVLASSEPTGAAIPVTGNLVFVPGVPRPRPEGTLGFVPQPPGAFIPVTGAVGDCTWVFSAVDSPPANVTYATHFVPETELPGSFPGLLVSCPVKVQAVTSTDLGSKTLVCWPYLPKQAGFAYYYDGSKWVKTTNSLTGDNQVCADMVAATAPNPAYVAVFNK